MKISISLSVVLLVISCFTAWSEPSPSPDPKVLRLHQIKIREVAAAFEKNDLAQSRILLEQAESILPDQIATLNFRGGILYKEKRYEEALAVFQTLISKMPNSYVGYFNIAEVLLAQKKYEEALAAFERILAASPKDEASQLRVVIILARQGKYDDARLRAKKLPSPGQTAAYYFAHAAIEYISGDASKGDHWIKQSELFFPPENSTELRKLFVEQGLLKK